MLKNEREGFPITAIREIKILKRLEENSVFYVEVKDKSLTIEFPDMMKYVDTWSKWAKKSPVFEDYRANICTD